MVSDMYAFDMETYNWERVIPTGAEKDTPRPRYFHSCDSCEYNTNLILCLPLYIMVFLYAACRISITSHSYRVNFLLFCMTTPVTQGLTESEIFYYINRATILFLLFP